MKLIEIIKELKVEVSKPNIFQAVVAKQYDMNTRFIKATLVDGTDIICIPSRPTVKAVINAQRSDGQAKGFDGEVNEDGTVTVPLHSWMLEMEGSVICDISIIDTAADDNKKLTTTAFTLLVERAAYGGSDVTNDPQYDVLVQLMEDCQEAYAAAQEALEKSNEALEKSTEADSKYDACVEATENANAVRAEIEAGGFIESLKEMNNGGKFSFWVGTQAEYDAITDKQDGCFYIISDDKVKEELQNTLITMQTNIDALSGGDYVVEQGTIDNTDDGGTVWHYRKWSSGWVELWGGGDCTTSFNTKIAEGHWQGEAFPAYEYPFKLSTKNGERFVHFTLYYTSDLAHISHCVRYHGGNNKTPTYAPFSAVQYSNTEFISGRYHVMARLEEEE